MHASLRSSISAIAQALLLVLAPCATYAVPNPYLLRDEENSFDAGNDSTMLVINPNGTVLEWNLPHGPNRVQGLSSIVAVSTGEGFKMALRADGTVWTWGSNYLGQLGLGDLDDRAAPTKIQGLENVIAISAGRSHALALKSDGSAWAWGANFAGEVGNGEYVYARPEQDFGDPSLGDFVTSPTQMQVSDFIVGIAAGNTFSLLLKSDQTVWGFGENSAGQLVHVLPDNGPQIPSFYTHLVQVPGLTDIIKIAAGSVHSIALKSDSSVWTWGNNWDGQLGNGAPHEELIHFPDTNQSGRAQGSE